MRIRVHPQTEGDAAGSRATSHRPRHAAASFVARLSSPHEAHLNSLFSAFGATTAALENPRFSSLSVHPLNRTRSAGSHFTEGEETTMIANALLFTIVILLGYGFWILDQLKFMARYKASILDVYGTTILIFLAVLFLNLFGGALAIGRRFFLKNTGRKLSHLDKQFNVSHSDLPAPMNEEDFN
jgi:hypothetical protein